MTRVGRRFHGREPSERSRPVPHRGPDLRAVVAGLALVVAGSSAGCGGGPGASVGVTTVGGDVVVMAKACGDGGFERIDVVDPGQPDVPLWRATLDDGPATRSVVVGATVDGYRVDDDRPAGALPGGRLRVLAEGPEGESWGGPRFEVSALRSGTLRVAGQDVPLDEWEAEPARCPDVGVGAALVAGLATALVAGALWLVVRGIARVVRRPDAGADASDV